jgi:hypothetical protein
MSAKKLLVAGIVGTVMLFTANTQTATAGGPRVRVVARPYVGAYWGSPYYYTYPTVYVPPAPVVTTPVVTTPVVSTYCGPYWGSGVYVAPRVGIRIR